MSSAYWLYSPQRLLLIQKGKDKEEDGDITEKVRKSYRSLGAIACSSLQSKKTSDVTILLTDKIASSKMVGIFENSFHLSNYENSHKKAQVDEESN